MFEYAKCVKCDYIQPLGKKFTDSHFYCSICSTKNTMSGRFLVFANGSYVAASVSKAEELLSQWDMAIANLNSGKHEYAGVRLRDCALSYDNSERAYCITYKGDKFKPEDIEIIGLAGMELANGSL